MNDPKVLIVTRHFPPILNGPSVVLSRLTKYWPYKCISVFTRSTEGTFESEDHSFVPDIAVERISWDYSWTRKGRILEFAKINNLVKKIIAVARHQKVDVILNVSDDGPFFIAAYLAARKLNIKLVLYLLDLYEEGRRSCLHKFIAKWFEPKIFSKASALLVMSERMQEYYNKKYNMASTVVPHPVDASEISERPLETAQQELKERPLRIIFTGMTTAAQAGSVIDLVKVVGKYPSEFSLKLCIPIKKGHGGFIDELPPNVEKVSLRRGEVFKAQRNADVLFLPFAFDNPYPDIIRTASPGKLPEYLGSGKPILYYGPKEAYVNWYFNKTKAAICVTTNNSEKLLATLRQLRNNADLRKKLAENALITSRRHEAGTVANVAWEVIKHVKG
ncbi:MAG: glycosyltransferase [Thermodesulfobacteriota bacterium]